MCSTSWAIAFASGRIAEARCRLREGPCPNPLSAVSRTWRRLIRARPDLPRRPPPLCGKADTPHSIFGLGLVEIAHEALRVCPLVDQRFILCTRLVDRVSSVVHSHCIGCDLPTTLGERDPRLSESIQPDGGT